MEYKLKVNNLKIYHSPTTGDIYIVAFTSKNTGTLIYTDSPNGKISIGGYSENWKKDKFTPFNGSITLSNEVE